jgi:hypothetical protein
MKALDKAAVSAFRLALSAIANAEAIDIDPSKIMVEGPIAGSAPGLGAGDAPRRALSEQDMLDIVDVEIRDLTADALRYDTLGKTNAADAIRDQIRALQTLIGY